MDADKLLLVKASPHNDEESSLSGCDIGVCMEGNKNIKPELELSHVLMT